MPDTELEPIPEDWSTALAFVAHPDDVEYGAASAVARWTAQGKRVVYVLATRGEAGIDGLAPPECARVREAEQHAAAAEVGVAVVEFLDHADGLVEYGLRLRRDVAAAVRRHRPDMVLTLNHHDTFGGGSWNTADHRAVGRAVLDGVRDAANRWVFPELGEPAAVRFVAVAASPVPTHAVDVTDSLDRGIASLRLHRAYLEGLGPSAMADPDAFLRGMAERAAARFGGRLAVPVEVVG